ncbi:hypothetical protein GOP47_0021827, partial [Adiantum capillus-veneris]
MDAHAWLERGRIAPQFLLLLLPIGTLRQQGNRGGFFRRIGYEKLSNSKNKHKAKELTYQKPCAARGVQRRDESARGDLCRAEVQEVSMAGISTSSSKCTDASDPALIMSDSESCAIQDWKSIVLDTWIENPRNLSFNHIQLNTFPTAIYNLSNLIT